MSDKRPCVVCWWDDKDPVLYGEFCSTKTFGVHYFCLLSGSNIPQEGTTATGTFKGFLQKDICDSTSLNSDVQCFYCKKKSAAVNCAFEGCDRSFHYPCGTRNNCITVMSGKFQSFCNRHVPDKNGGKEHGDEFCGVCFELLESYHPASAIISSCCLKLDDWNKCFVHKKCVRQYVDNAGYDSMCISCPMKDLSRDEWQDEMRERGIFIPMSKAVWEKDDQFKDQVKNKCKHPQCLNPGVSKNVFTCFVCGCYPRHLNCARVKSFEDYHCPKCYDQSFVERVPRLSAGGCSTSFD